MEKMWNENNLCKDIQQRLLELSKGIYTVINLSEQYIIFTCFYSGLKYRYAKWIKIDPEGFALALGPHNDNNLDL